MKSIKNTRINSNYVVAMLLATGCTGHAIASEAADEPVEASSSDNYVKLGGYVRTWASMNLQDHPETGGGKGELSMLRGSLSLNMDAKTGPVQWKVIGRADREVLTHYEKGLQDLVRTNTPGGPGSSMVDEYNQTQLREYYADFDIGERAHFRVGKQEVAWGETDFFHPTDLINGFDYRWRSFLERDNDELRKPLLMLNGRFDIPELNGSLQALVRPGIDKLSDIGNTYELSGGRWAGQPFKGVDFLAPGALTLNYRHRNGDEKDVTGGLRWTGLMGSANYSLSYLNTYRPDPVVNSAFNPWGEKPKGTLGDFIFPKINVFGASISNELPAIDAVVAGEIAYQKNVPYNTGSNFFNGALPGFGGIVTKDVIVSSLRLDKQLRLMDLLGTSENTLLSFQLFDTWIRNLKASDDIVYAAGYGKNAKSHTTTVTGFFTLNYMNSRLNPGLAAGWDISNGDTFLIPSIEYKYGNNWRFLAEADFFFPRHQKNPGQIENSTGPLGGLAHNNQFLLRATYQF